MFASCQTNEAFEDSLTEGQEYPIIQWRNASVLICNDQDVERWYGMGRFAIAPTPITK